MAASAALVFAGKSVATPAISFLINKAFSYINEHFKSKDMDVVKNRLLLAMPQIQAVLDVVSPERVREQSSALDAWLWQLRDAVEAAEDAIDELEYHELEEKAKDRKVSDWGSPFGKMKHKVVRSVKSVPVLNKTLKKSTHSDTLKRLMKSVDGLDKAAAGVVSFLNLIDHLGGGSTSSHQQVQKLVDNSRHTGSTLSSTIFVGREKEKEQITGWLATTVESDETGGTRTNSIPIISVVGHGGMGKTTLAQSICEQDEVLKNYKVIWITVSTSFDATSVTSKILECVTGVKPSADNLEPLQQGLIEKLRSLNFLLVLDDVWEDKRRDEWEKLFAPLKKLNTTRSRILLTTRMQSVADMAAKVMRVKRDQCLTLQGLEEDENLELFTHHAFSGLNIGDYVYLKSTGEQIAKKLRGCPLVTKVVGEHLQDNMMFEYWSRFLDHGLEHFKGTEDDIVKVLRLSYYHLPTELQICFRYCCIFPQDHRFEKKELVQLWIGSGLISQPTSDIQTLVDTAEQFLALLTRKSFFDLQPIAGVLKEERYVMHDLMHELARNVSTGECAIIDDPVQLKDEKDTVRHLCIVNIYSFTAEEVMKISHFRNLRTIIIYSLTQVVTNIEMVCALEMIIASSKSLRLFHSNLWTKSHLADKIAKLKHLRYIYVDRMTPDMIFGVAKLYHLLVLRCGHHQLATERYEARYLGNLEHLRYVSYGLNGFGTFPISRLGSLQELHDYRVGGSICNKISAIGNLRELRTLELKSLEEVESYEDAKNAKLKEKQHLNELCLEWSTPGQIMTNDLVLGDLAPPDQIMRNELVLDHLEPPGNVKLLEIKGYDGPKIPFWIENRSAKNLVSLKLIGCTNFEYLPSLSEFVLLKVLALKNLPKLLQIGGSSDMSSSSSMELLPQSLETLFVAECRNLCELPLLPPGLEILMIHDVFLTKLPMIGKISSESISSKSSKLFCVSVKRCPHITSLEGSFLDQKLHIGALSVLNVSYCNNLELASIPFEEMKELQVLKIKGCPKLRSMGDAVDKLVPLSLQRLIYQCGDLELPLLGSLQLLTNLSSLKLQNCSSMVSLPSADVFKSLRSLQNVDIRGCENLLSLGGLESLSSLNSLCIVGCSLLVEAARLTLYASGSCSGGKEEHLVEPINSLLITSLVICQPSLLILEPLKSLGHTERLIVCNGLEMDWLPERWLLQNRTSLQQVTVHRANYLKSLPPSMQDLCPLKKLFLYNVKELQSVPYLPSSLSQLILSECHLELKKKVSKHGSPEWNKIAHISDARIGGCFFVMGQKSTALTTFVQLMLGN